MRDEDKRGRDDKDNVGKELHEGCTAGQNRRRRRKERTSKPDALGSAQGQSMEDVQRKRWYRSTLDRTQKRERNKRPAHQTHTRRQQLKGVRRMAVAPAYLLIVRVHVSTTFGVGTTRPRGVWTQLFLQDALQKKTYLVETCRPDNIHSWHERGIYAVVVSSRERR